MSVFDRINWDDVPAGRHAMARLDDSGDTKYMWDPGNERDVRAAREHFDDMKDRGFAAFKVDKRGNKIESEKVTEFNQYDEKLIFVPPMAGGA